MFGKEYRRMNAKTRSKLDMGDRALNFSRAHPDASPGYAAALTGLEQRLTKARELARAQQEGINQRKAANARKNKLRRQMSKTQLRHLARVAKVATKETPELAGKLVLKSQPRAYRSFRAVAGTMVAEAQTQKELLVKHGLADTVLESLCSRSTNLTGRSPRAPMRSGPTSAPGPSSTSSATKWSTSYW
jgi:hypothetical protein